MDLIIVVVEWNVMIENKQERFKKWILVVTEGFEFLNIIHIEITDTIMNVVEW